MWMERGQRVGPSQELRRQHLQKRDKDSWQLPPGEGQGPWGYLFHLLGDENTWLEARRSEHRPPPAPNF